METMALWEVAALMVGEKKRDNLFSVLLAEGLVITPLPYYNTMISKHL